MSPQLYPFSKNRYFPHKRMRTADFIRDQEYTEKKLAFLSRWDFGTGVALGLEVQRIDGDSLLVSPGFAVDGYGRWLIVDEPAVCRVRTLQGFDALHGETAILWLAYREELSDPMFVPGGRDEVQEYAVAQERFSFRLTDMRALPGAAGDQALFSDVVLFEDADLRIRQVIPRALPARGLVQLKLVIESFCTERLEIGLHYFPELPGWNPASRLSFDQTLQLEKGETSLVLTGALETTAQAVLLSLPERGFMLEKRGVRLRAQNSFQEEFPVVAGDPLAALESRLLSQDPRELWDGGLEEGVPVAGIRLLRYGDQVLLDGIFPLSGNRRAVLPCLKERLQYCRAFFPASPETGARERAASEPPPACAPPEERRQMAAGVVTLNAGLHLQEGNILRSDEIVHELGPGTVFIAFGIENVYPAVDIDRNYTDLLLGDASLFSQASGTYDCGFDRGVRIHPEKGTFELAVRLKGELRQTSLRLRWFAWRAEEHAVHRPPAGTLLRLEPDVARAAPGATVNFVPVFEHGTASPCDFLIPDKQSGVITPNGIYTAPQKDGLYQVCAQIKDMPETRVNAFVIVRTWMEGAEHASGTL